MKKLFIMALLAIGTMAYADDYKYLTIGYNSVEKSIELATIQKITFNDGNVVVATNNGDQAFPLNQMEKMFFSPTATGIEAINKNQGSMFNGQSVYDLTGRRVEKATKGIYIVDGKKIVIK